MSKTRSENGRLELHWSTDLRGTIYYQLYAVEETGQLVLLGTFDQGPFDTSLEVAQWVIRVIAREVPPAFT